MLILFQKVSLLLLLLNATFTFAQSIQDKSYDLEAVAQLGKLWGHIAYFHPDISQNSTEWNAHFVREADKIISQNKKIESAIKDLLKTLNDPLTQINSDSSSASNIPFNVSVGADSVIRITNFNKSALANLDWQSDEIRGLKKELATADGVVFDLRRIKESSQNHQSLHNFFTLIAAHLSTSDISLPSLTARYHDGFVPEGAFETYYSNGIYSKSGDKIYSATQNAKLKTVFLIGENAEVPLLAYALQKNGNAVIFSETKLSTKNIGHTVIFDLLPLLSLSLKVSKLPDSKVFQENLLLTNLNESETEREYLRFLKEDVKSVIDYRKSIYSNHVEEEETSQNLYPSVGERILAVAKIYSVINYFYPYKHLMDEDWDEIYLKFIPKFISAENSEEYALTVAGMYHYLNDGHGFVQSDVLNNYFGNAVPPIIIRFIEDKLLITKVFPNVKSNTQAEVGDIITRINGESVKDRYESLKKYYAYSNPQNLNFLFTHEILKGQDSTYINLELLDKNGETKNISLLRTKTFFDQYWQYQGRNLPVSTKLLENNIGYVDLAVIRNEETVEMYEKFENTNAIIFDLRGYPNGTRAAIISRLTTNEKNPGALFKRNAPKNMQTDDTSDYLHPNSETFFFQKIKRNNLPVYRGKTVVLIDERAISQSEHMGLFFKTVTNSVFIGTHTSGTNGDITFFNIPGNIRLFFSGHNVSYPDGTQLQRIGIVPDVHVKETIESIRNGEDAVLNTAIKYIEELIK